MTEFDVAIQLFVIVMLLVFCATLTFSISLVDEFQPGALFFAYAYLEYSVNRGWFSKWIWSSDW